MPLVTDLPAIRGEYRENANLAKTTWFGVGGNAEILFRPKDSEDLAYFVSQINEDLDINVLGVGSNLLIRDGGIRGIVVKLGREFTKITHNSDVITVGAGCLNYNLATFCKEHSLSGLEFLIGIPGGIGGSIAMNAGSYGLDISSCLISAKAINSDGDIVNLRNEDIGFVYRGNMMGEGWIFTEACFRIVKDDQDKIIAKMNQISEIRESTQPIHSKTSGSTFKNPSGHKAWELIDKAGCRGLKIGDAIVSEKHCNFLINLGAACAKNIEDLGEEVKKRVFEKSGIMLDWEIKIIGDK
jgi:UDP-N-acetylmuramate dehydrogenase